MEIIDIQPNFGIPAQEEKLFVPLIDKLREVSSDKTLPENRKLIDLQSNVYDMISVTDDSLIESFVYDEKTNSIVIKYTNGEVKTFTLEDNYLSNVNFDSNSKSLSFNMKDGKLLTISLNDFYNKEEIDNKNSIKWNYF